MKPSQIQKVLDRVMSAWCDLDNAPKENLDPVINASLQQALESTNACIVQCESLLRSETGQDPVEKPLKFKRGDKVNFTCAVMHGKISITKLRQGIILDVVANTLVQVGYNNNVYVVPPHKITAVKKEVAK